MFKNKEYAYRVYKEGSFNKAAEKLHISPPALSAMIKRIETQLGMPIFNRKTSPISLTSFGVEYIKSIEAVNELEERVHNAAYELQTAQTGRLIIYASNLNVDYPISEAIAKFKNKYPKIKVSVVNMNTVISKQMLDSGEMDLFITARPLDEREYVRTLIAKEQLILVVPRDLSINEKFKVFQLNKNNINMLDSNSVKGVDLHEFRSIPFILSSRGNYLRSCTDRMFFEAGFEPQANMEVEESSVATNFARYGVGATIISNALLERSDFEHHFCLYKINSEHALRKVYICYRTGSYVTTAIEKFLNMFSELV
ncbi:LysR family transcriptional regulator [Eubacteriales bacterium]|nr:LysR family transcriptional regulator [Eubacteriales bacterium]